MATLLATATAWAWWIGQHLHGIKYLGWAARLFLWLGSRRVRFGGHEFFPTRAQFEREYADLEKRFGKVRNVSGIWVAGLRFMHHADQITKLRRVILPDPYSASLTEFSRTIKAPGLSRQIEEATKLAQDHNIKVKWCKIFLYQMITLADTDSESGWVHIESVTPFSDRKLRPSFTINRKFSREAVAEAQRVFDELWDSPEDVHEPKFRIPPSLTP